MCRGLLGVAVRRFAEPHVYVPLCRVAGTRHEFTSRPISCTVSRIRGTVKSRVCQRKPDDAQVAAGMGPTAFRRRSGGSGAPLPVGSPANHHGARIHNKTTESPSPAVWYTLCTAGTHAASRATERAASRHSMPMLTPTPSFARRGSDLVLRGRGARGGGAPTICGPLRRRTAMSRVS